MHAAATPSRKTKLWCETSLKNEKVQDVKTKLSCETSLRNWKLKMRKQSFRDFAQKSENGRYENEAFVRDFLPKFQFSLVKIKPELAIPLRGRSEHDPLLAERVPQPSRGKPSPFIFRDTFCPAKKTFRTSAISQNRISCQTSHKICQLTMWKRSLRATLPSKFESWRCESEAFVRDLPQSVKVKDVKTKISRARVPSKNEGWS